MSENTVEKILKNKDLMRYMRRVVEIAEESGICKSNVKKAIDTVWEEMYPAIDYPLTAGEEKFLTKVKAFVKYYREDLKKRCEEVAKRRRMLEYFKSDEEFFSEIVIASLGTLCIMYKRGAIVTVQTFEKFIKKYFEESSRRWFDKVTIRHIFSSMDFAGQQMPRFSSWPYKSIFEEDEYMEFVSQYKGRMQVYSYTESAMMATWFIEKYF